MTITGIVRCVCVRVRVRVCVCVCVCAGARFDTGTHRCRHMTHCVPMQRCAIRDWRIGVMVYLRFCALVYMRIGLTPSRLMCFGVSKYLWVLAHIS